MTSTSKPAYTHTVEVGKADYSITPDVIRAEVGDFIRYQFYPKNHSIVRAAYEYPCVPYELVNTRPGFFSGFRPVDNILKDPPSYTIRVNDTEPIFVYCSGPWACTDHAMVAVVNPNANTSLERHKQLALEASYVLNPGDDWPAEGDGHPKPSGYSSTITSHAGPQTVTISPSSTGSSVSSAAAATSGAATTSSQSSHGLTGGVIAGIAIGAAAVLLLAAIAIWICGRRSIHSRSNNHDSTWFLNGKNGGFSSGTATPATMPPAYNHHGVPIMTQNKAYPNGLVGTNITEHYIPAAGSPPPPVSPPYAQQNFPPHIRDPTAFQHAAFGTPNIPAGQTYAMPINQPQFSPSDLRGVPQQRSEIYSGTPAPQQASPTAYGLSASGQPSTVPVFTRNSLSMSGNSRGGSPDLTAEMNAARSQAGTLNQAGGGMLQQPMPVRSNDFAFAETGKHNV